MAFKVKDDPDLVRLLQKHPEWRAELRRLLPTDELLALPELVQSLAETQWRTEEHITTLADAQRQTEERLSHVEEQIANLANAQRCTEERVQTFIETQERLIERQERLIDTVRDLKGRVLERTYVKVRPVPTLALFSHNFGSQIHTR